MQPGANPTSPAACLRSMDGRVQRGPAPRRARRQDASGGLSQLRAPIARAYPPKLPIRLAGAASLHERYCFPRRRHSIRKHSTCGSTHRAQAGRIAALASAFLRRRPRHDRNRSLGLCSQRWWGKRKSANRTPSPPARTTGVTTCQPPCKREKMPVTLQSTVSDVLTGSACTLDYPLDNLLRVFFRDTTDAYIGEGGWVRDFPPGSHLFQAQKTAWN